MKKIEINDLDKEPDVIHNGRWVNEKNLTSWLTEYIDDITAINKIRPTEEKKGMLNALKTIRKWIAKK